MFRINLRTDILLGRLISCVGSRSGFVVAVCLVSLAPKAVVGGDPTPFIAPTGESAGSFFGHSVSDAGDVNDDGFGDVIVGAPFGGSGRAYVYFGGSSTDEIADITLAGEPGVSTYGFPVSSAGDINGDGIADLMVCAAGDNTFLGRVYIYFEGPGADTTADLILFGEVASDQFGAAAADAGDVNGDGFDDVIVGAPYNDAGGPGFGRAYVYCGGPSLDAIADLVLTGQEANDYLGYSVSAGDVDGDGSNDLIVGALSNAEGDFEVGRVFIYYGGPDWDSIVDFKLTGEEPFDLFSHSVAGGADFNGDGFDEVIVGGLYANRVEIDYGGPDTEETPTADLILYGEMPGNVFGARVSDAGDMNGDGYGDVIVGGGAADGSDGGRAYVYLGGPSPDDIADLTMAGEAPFDGFGYGSGAGDFNGDGYDDVVVGASRNDFAGQDAGRAYVYLGGSELTPGGQDVSDANIDSPSVGEILLSSPYPNPLHAARTSFVQFALGRSASVHLSLQDVQGRTVANRERESFAGGTHSVSWNPGVLPSGVYYLRIEADGDVATRKWVILR